MSNPTRAVQPAASVEGAASNPTPASAFDPASHRKGQRQGQEGQPGKKQTTIPVRKPGSEYFFRAHPSSEYRATYPLLVDKEVGTYYLVHPEFNAPEEVDRRIEDTFLITCVFTGGSVFLWPIRETSNSWAESGRAALQEATTSWVRLHGNRVIGGYDVEYPKLEPKPAVFPTEPFTKIIERAFKSNLIESEEHPLVKRLMGIF